MQLVSFLLCCLLMADTIGAEVIHLQKSHFKTRAEFVETIYPHAVEAAKILKVDPKVLVAQAAHETSWGKRIPKSGNISSYNLFGIKASSKHVKQVKSNTKEYWNGKTISVKHGFRAYDNYSDCFCDYAGMLKRNKRYSKALQNAHHPHNFLVELQKAGYATDPHYAKKIFSIYQGPILKKLI